MQLEGATEIWKSKEKRYYFRIVGLGEISLKEMAYELGLFKDRNKFGMCERKRICYARE